MAYVMSFHNKYFGLIFADTADGKSYTDKPAKAHRFATKQDVTPEARKNFALVATDLYNQLAPDNHTFRPSSVWIDDESAYESKESPMKCSMLKKKESLTKEASQKDPEWDKYLHDVKVFIGKHYIKNIMEWVRKRGNTIKDEEGNQFINMVASCYDADMRVAKAAKLLSEWVTTNDHQHTEWDGDPKSPLERQIMLFDSPAESKKNEDASLDGVVQKVSEGLDTIQKRLESSVNDKEMSDGYWLHLDFDGVLDNRVTGVTDSTHYDVADYEWEPDETQEIPCRIYRLSVDPGIYDDDGKFVNDNNMSSISYDICVEVAPDGEDITLDILKSENKFGSKSSTITRSLSFSCDSDGVSDMVDSVVGRVMDDLGNYDYLG